MISSNFFREMEPAFFSSSMRSSTLYFYYRLVVRVLVLVSMGFFSN